MTTSRRGFTLIELLVTMGLIILLLSIALAVSNSATADSYKIIGAGDRLSQALLTAKSRAARDRAPRGVRLVIGPDGYIRELVYIEQNEAWQIGQSPTMTQNGTVSAVEAVRSQVAMRYQYTPVAVPSDASKPQPVNCQAFLLLTTLGPNADFPRFISDVRTNRIDEGTIVSIPDIGAAFVIPSSFFGPAGSRASWTPTLASWDNAAAPGLVALDLKVSNLTNPDFGAGFTNLTATSPTNLHATFQTSTFGIYAKSGPGSALLGEQSVVLSKNAAVDPAASFPAVTPTTTDILFGPDGQVMFRPEPLLTFLIRDTFKFSPPPVAGNWLLDPSTSIPSYRQAGEMILVTVYTRTGAISSRPVAEPDGTTASDPYKFAKDSIKGGL